MIRRAIERHGSESLLLPELLPDEQEWRPQTYLRFSSHKPIVGPLIVFIKRRVLLPLTRWLYEYSLENFRTAGAREPRAVCLHRGAGG